MLWWSEKSTDSKTSSLGDHTPAARVFPASVSAVSRDASARQPSGSGVTSCFALKNTPDRSSGLLDHDQSMKPSRLITIIARRGVISSHFRIAAVKETP